MENQKYQAQQFNQQQQQVTGINVKSTQSDINTTISALCTVIQDQAAEKGVDSELVKAVAELINSAKGLLY